MISKSAGPRIESLGVHERGMLRRKRGLLHRIRRVPWWMMAPSLTLIVLVYYYPTLTTLFYSVFSWDGFNPPTFVGFANYMTYLMTDTTAVEWIHQAILTGGTIAISLVLPLAAAEAVHGMGNTRISYAVKVLLVVPIVVPFIVNVGLWSFIFNPQTGPLNHILAAVGLRQLENNWLGDSNMALPSILGVSFPWVAGLPFLIYLAGLQAISREMYDAFYMESGSFLRRFLHIDLPMIRGQMRLVIILSVIGSLQNYLLILLLTNGGPGYATQVPGLSMYTQAFVNDQYGVGAAIGTVLFFAILVITLVYLGLERVISRETV